MLSSFSVWTLFSRELLLVTERALLLSVAQCERDGLEQGLWKAVFHQLIERGRQQLRDSTGPTEAQAIQAWLLALLDEVLHSLTILLYLVFHLPL